MNVVRRFVRGLGEFIVEITPFVAVYLLLAAALSHVATGTVAVVVAVSVVSVLMVADEVAGRPVRAFLERYGPLPTEEGSA